MLWFDVEEKGNTTKPIITEVTAQLWFDVEEKGNTTGTGFSPAPPPLWFDVEEKGNTTEGITEGGASGCGLM